MRSFGQYFLAGAAGVLALKILGGLLFPILAMVLVFFGLMFKLALIVAVVWFILRLLKRLGNDRTD